jgi:hypothetical protein
MEDKDVLLATSHTKALRMPAFMRSILLHMLRDKRELQTVFVLLRFIFTMLPCACAVFCSGSHLAGLLYVILMATTFSTDTLTAMHHFMHNHSAFKHKAATWFVSPASTAIAPRTTPPSFASGSRQSAALYKGGHSNPPWSV